MGQLSGRVALVTGASRGIGRAIATELARRGAAVAVNFRRDRDAADAAVSEIEAFGGVARAYMASIDSLDDCTAMVEKARADFGPITLLVNNAGGASRGQSVVQTDPAEVERIVRTHALGPHQLCKLVIPDMRSLQQGDIVMVSSASTNAMPANAGPYNMAKAAMEALALTLAKEERANGIRVNILAPGLVVTDMGTRFAKAAFGTGDPDALDARSPFGRACRPDDVAAVVAFLVSDGSRYITGQRIALDGGDSPVRAS